MAGERHLLLVASGSYTDVSDQTETWQCGIRLIMSRGVPDPSGTLNTPVIADRNDTMTDGDVVYTTRWGVDGGFFDDPFEPMDWLHDQAWPAWLAFVESGVFSSQVTLASLKASPIKENGLVDGGRTATAVTSGSHHGTSGGDLLPLQVATVVSWQTAVIGRHGRGRIYLPAAAKDDYAGHGRMTTTYRDLVNAGAIALLEGISFIGPTGPNRIAIIPIVTGSPWTHYGTITSVHTDDVPDTQRRRRKALVGARVTGSVSY